MPNEELEMTMQTPSTKKQNSQFEYKREDTEKGFLNDPREIAEFVRNQQKDILQIIIDIVLSIFRKTELSLDLS